MKIKYSYRITKFYSSFVRIEFDLCHDLFCLLDRLLDKNLIMSYESLVSSRVLL